MERTWRFKQADIAQAVHIGVARKAAELTLDTYGPYTVAYTRNGRHMLLGGSKGHLAIVDWNRFSVTAEFHVRETVHDVTFLHNSSLFAAAQLKYAYIYDGSGMEVHVLRHHVQPLALDFLPHHMLLASVGNAGFLKFQDVSTGALVAEHRTRAGPCSLLRQNPWNGVEVLGHGSGAVTMWTPNLSTPVVKMRAHVGPLTALAVDAGGRYAVTGGIDSRVKVWDIRAFRDEPVHSYFTPTPARAIDISATGCVAVGYGSHVQVWGHGFGLEGAARSAGGAADGPRARSLAPKALNAVEAVHGGDGADDDDVDEHQQPSVPRRDHGAAAAALGVRKAVAPYMRHELPGKPVHSVRFRPFDDVLAVGHAKGLSSILVPGAGEANYDSRAADPFESRVGRREGEVRALLDKLPPTTITLNPGDVATVDAVAPAVRERELREAAAASAAAGAGVERRKKGKSSSERRRLKKNANVITAQRMAVREAAIERKAAEVAAAAEAAAAASYAGGRGNGGTDRRGVGAAPAGPAADALPSALTRFFPRKTQVRRQ